MDYITVYLEIIALTFVYMGVLFVNVRSEMGNKREVEIFRAILMFMALALIADSITQIQYRGFVHLPPFLVAFLYGFYMFVFSGVLPFLWLVFVELRLGSSLLRKRGALIVSAIPLMFVSVMAFASIKTGWFFEVDEYGIYTRGDYWSLQVIVNYCYFLFTTIHALIAAKTEPSPVQRKQYYVLASFVIAFLLLGLPSFTYLSFITIIICMIGAIIDELGNDNKQIYSKSKFLEYFFDYRFALKVVILLLVLIGLLNIWSFIYFLCFEIAYEIARVLFENYIA